MRAGRGEGPTLWGERAPHLTRFLLPQLVEILQQREFLLSEREKLNDILRSVENE